MKIGLINSGSGIWESHLQNIQEIISPLQDALLIKIGQYGSWTIFLNGKDERTCTIPAGKAILVPLLTGNCDANFTTANAPASESDPNLIQCAKAGDEYGGYKCQPRWGKTFRN